MPLMLPAQDLLEPVDDASGVELPPRFAEALERARAVIARCGGAQSACSRAFERRFGADEPAVAHTQTMSRKHHMTERKK